ncbi:MAG: DUF4230 domain-containing protein [Eubacteriales bacterium]|nr:DUF4230 domain-containing protein [Eubacteriales bacterium]
MKKIITLFLAMITLLSCVACGKAEEKLKNMEPQVSQMKAICELAVMECYYHNVAKFTEEDAEGTLWWKKDKHFWVEYSGVVKLGIDVSLVNIEVADTQITITIPEAKVLGCKVDSASLSDDSFIVDKDSAAIDADDEIAAFGAAQTKLEEIASNDKALLAGAQQRAQALLEDYIYNIGNAVGKTYFIKWVYLNANGSPIGTTNVDSSSTAEEPTT